MLLKYTIFHNKLQRKNVENSSVFFIYILNIHIYPLH